MSSPSRIKSILLSRASECFKSDFTSYLFPLPSLAHLYQHLWTPYWSPLMPRCPTASSAYRAHCLTYLWTVVHHSSFKTNSSAMSSKNLSWHLSFELPLSPGDACHSNYALLHLPVLTHICMGIPKATFRQRTGTQSLGNEGSKGFWLLDMDTRSAVLKNRKKVAFPKK